MLPRANYMVTQLMSTNTKLPLNSHCVKNLTKLSWLASSTYCLTLSNRLTKSAINVLHFFAETELEHFNQGKTRRREDNSFFSKHYLILTQISPNHKLRRLIQYCIFLLRIFDFTLVALVINSIPQRWHTKYRTRIHFR